jgi:nuclear pore complex protein Nup133
MLSTQFGVAYIYMMSQCCIRFSLVKLITSSSWDVIRNTVNISDTELAARYRRTALYGTLHSVLLREETQQHQGYVTEPNVALLIPAATELSSRWPGLPPDQIEALMQDFTFECDKLGDLELDDVYERVKELVEKDVEWENHYDS